MMMMPIKVKLDIVLCLNMERTEWEMLSEQFENNEL